MIRRKNNNDKEELTESSLEVGMLSKSTFNDQELDNYLRQGEIKASEKPPVPPQILWVGDCTIATFGNFSASTGKAKSKKTFNITAMVAAAVNNSTVLKYRASLPDGKRRVLYFDTEQSRFHCHNVIERIYRLAGLSLTKEDKRIKFYGLREFTPTLRIALIDYALRTFEGVGLVIIDGLRDLMYDINNAKESTDVMTMLMAWTSKYNLHIEDEVYKQGYSLESLRDLEMVHLNSPASRDGYFFDDSIHHLFSLLANGHHADLSLSNNKSFRVRPIDSPLFNDKNLHHLGEVRIRNIKWQEIIRALSLSKKKNYCGRISYANLGVNQLGSVYESLLAYRGFYAEEDYIEVHKANEPQDGTFLVPYSRMSDFDISEVLCNQEGEPIILPKGTFVYRLNGRDRQKSASYYTPEVLTRSTVKYTLKSIIDEVRENKRRATELLELKILEPAMGAAAFQNEVINQLSEAYLLHQQRQLREKGIHNWRIAPDHYRDELQKVKAYIATHNVYGVDLNPTAIELGKLSLWLNVIHKDMETPFFANRLTVGNAVIGAWLKVYSKNQFYGISDRYGSKLKPNKWWECAPHKVKFFKNSVNRSVNEVYHFLLPDANMLGVRSIKEQKKLHPNEDRRMTTILKDWTAPVGAHEFQILQRISAKIDILLKEHFTDQLTIEKYTNNRKEVWDGIDHSAQESLFKNAEQVESYAQKQRLFDTRYGHNNAYRKLKLVMDYWCALWFWSYDDTLSMPTREEYWKDIEALLAVDNDRLDRRTRLALERTGKGMLAEDDTEFNRITDEEAQIVARTQEELLTEARGSRSLFADDDPMRFKIVARLSERYHFFHPMLEFLEVFWLRDGFDIICGNPPWLKLEFDEQGIISEKYPEIAIRKISAPQARTMRENFFTASPQLKRLYNDEELENAGSAAFMNAYCNYPLLEGQQTNLYKCVLENGFAMLSDKGYMGLLHPEGVYDDPNGQPLRKDLYRRLRYHFQYQNAFNLFPIGHREKYGTSIYGGYQDISFYSINVSSI